MNAIGLVLCRIDYHIPYFVHVGFSLATNGAFIHDGFFVGADNGLISVSYTHLDVYKRQVLFRRNQRNGFQ